MKKKTIGGFLAELRKEKGITQKELAEFLNVSDKTISHWECDENSPDLSMFPILAEYFGVTCDELLKGERKQNNSSDFPVSVSSFTHNSEDRIKYETEAKFSKAYGKHKILCISSVFISFFSLAILAGIIAFVEYMTAFYYIKEAVFIAVAFSVALCLLITFISSQNFNTLLDTADYPEDKKGSFRKKGRLNCIFPLVYVAIVVFLVFMVLMPSGKAGAGVSETATMTIPESIETDASTTAPLYPDTSVPFSEQ